MMKSVLRMRFVDEAEAIAVLAPWFRGEDDDGVEHWIIDGEHHTFRPLGALVKTSAVPGDDPEGPPAVPPIYFEGWHCDVLFNPGNPGEAEVRLAAAEYAVNPSPSDRAHSFAGED